MSGVEDRPRHLLIRTERDEGGGVRLSVQDSGVGFDPQAAARPGMSGPDLQQELTRRQKEIPIVFIMAHRDVNVRPRLLERGAVECLFKPFSEAALLEALNAALRVS